MLGLDTGTHSVTLSVGNQEALSLALLGTGCSGGGCREQRVTAPPGSVLGNRAICGAHPAKTQQDIFGGRLVVWATKKPILESVSRILLSVDQNIWSRL